MHTATSLKAWVLPLPAATTTMVFFVDSSSRSHGIIVFHHHIVIRLSQQFLSRVYDYIFL
jgi:hypothetical protein